eukprot:3265936-Prymnesium_polylepis.2
MHTSVEEDRTGRAHRTHVGSYGLLLTGLCRSTVDDQRLRYDAYHGSTGLPPGSTSAGEPNQHEQAVQRGTRVRLTELKVKGKTTFSQHEQGPRALRSNRITHMTPSMH